MAHRIRTLLMIVMLIALSLPSAGAQAAAVSPAPSGPTSPMAVPPAG